MNKSDLASKIAKQIGSTKELAELSVDAFVNVVKEAVAKKDKVQLFGFGTFLSNHREERNGRNPKTGKTIKIEACDVPVFKSSKSFKDFVNS
jgi:DNA-binding protein HU-beta